MKMAELLEMLTPEFVKEHRPDLAEALAGAPAEELKAIKTQTEADKLARHKESLIADASKLVAESKLPEQSQKRITTALSGIEVKVDTTKEAYAIEAGKVIAAEKEYVESLTKTAASGNGSGSEAEESFDKLLDAVTTEVKE